MKAKLKLTSENYVTDYGSIEPSILYDCIIDSPDGEFYIIIDGIAYQDDQYRWNFIDEEDILWN